MPVDQALFACSGTGRQTGPTLVMRRCAEQAVPAGTPAILGAGRRRVSMPSDWSRRYLVLGQHSGRRSSRVTTCTRRLAARIRSARSMRVHTTIARQATRSATGRERTCMSCRWPAASATGVISLSSAKGRIGGDGSYAVADRCGCRHQGAKPRLGRLPATGIAPARWARAPLVKPSRHRPCCDMLCRCKIGWSAAALTVAAKSERSHPPRSQKGGFGNVPKHARRHSQHPAYQYFRGAKVRTC